MKKIYFFLLAVAMLLPVSLKAQTIIVNEGFEDGIPSTWTQEYVDGQQAWKVETGGTMPQGVVAGKNRAVLRNETGQTQGYKTRLVTPVLNIKTDAQGQPINTPFLSFFYAAEKWTADFDTLVVLYRTDPNEDWEVLRQFKSAQRNWTKINIDLPQPSDKYQIAFEGTDNMGRGIVLDSILIRSALECTTPYSIYTTNLNDGVITIGWQASFDAEQFEIAIANKAVDITSQDLNDASVVVDHKVIDFTPSFLYTTPKLATNVTYHVYIRSICETEVSEWGEYNFYMTPQVGVPYVQNFNLPANDSRLSRMTDWSYGGNVDAFVPAVNTNLLTNLNYYSNDGTYAMMFVGGNGVNIDVPAGSYIYAVTPELQNVEVKNLQVKFWGTVNQATYRNYAHSIIVGVMSDPDDVLSFTPIRTVSIEQYRQHKEFIVSLASYTGNGKRVAFLSQFDQPNQFYIDNVEISTIEVAPKVETVKVTPAETAATFSWAKTENAKYNVIVSKENYKNAANLTEAQIVKKVSDLTDATWTATGLEETTDYYVYVNYTLNGTTSEWSNAAKFRTLFTKSLPFRYGFESDEKFYTLPGSTTMYPTELSLYTNSPSLPAMQNRAGHESSYALYVNQSAGYDTWAVFPKVENPKDLYMLFYMTALIEGNVADSRVLVGVMEDPADLSTFTTVSDVAGTAIYSRQYVDFSTYIGNGKYIALYWREPEGRKDCISYIDDVVIAERGNCSAPANIVAATTDSSAVITWDKGDATKWNIRVSTTLLNETQLDFISGNVYNANGIETNQVEVKNLSWASRYYVYLQSVCSGDESSLWVSTNFMTNCLEKMPLPYVVNFEGVREGGRGEGFFQSCWTRNNDYPYLQQSDSINRTHTGKGSIQLRASRTFNHETWVAAPALDANLKNVKLSFWAKISTSAPLEISVLTDQNDITTKTVIDTIWVATSYTKYDVYFDKYIGTGKYVCFYAFINDVANNSFFDIDDVEFSSALDQRPYNLTLTDLSQTSIKFAWEGLATNNEFEVMICTSAQSNPNNPVETAILKRDTITQKSYEITSLTSNTLYYVYVRSLNGTEWVSAAYKTECSVETINYTESFESPAPPTSETNIADISLYTPSCWTVGNVGLTNPANNTNRYIPHIYNNANANLTTGGSRCLYMSSTKAYYIPWACMPRIDVEDITRLIVTFAAQGTNGKYLVIGVMSDPNDISTFIPVDSIRMTGMGADKKVFYDLELADYDGNGKYIAFRGQWEQEANTYYIDEVSLALSRCAAPNPSISRLTDNSVRVASGLSLKNRNPWKVYYTKTKLNLDSLNQGANSAYLTGVDSILATANDVMAQLNNLDELSTYYVYVAGNCDDGTSRFKELTFTTLCKPVKPEQFGGSGDGVETWETYKAPTANTIDARLAADYGCWRFGIKSATASYMGIPAVLEQTTTSAAAGFGKSLNLYTASSFTGAYMISPRLDVDDITKYQVRFKACTGNSSAGQALIVGVISDPSDLSTMVNLDTISMEMALNYNVSNFIVPFDALGGDNIQNYKSFYFLCESTGSNNIYIDDVSVELIPSCRIPNHLVVDNASITESGATVTWNGDAAKYRVAVAKEWTTEPGKYKKHVLVQQVDTNAVVLAGLEPSTKYYVYVQSICDDVEGGWATDGLKFRTLCPEEGFDVTSDKPYTMNFNDFANGAEFDAGSCWTRLYHFPNMKSKIDNTKDSVSVSYPTISTGTYARGGVGTYIYFYNMASTTTTRTITYGVLPYIKTDLNKLQLSFYYRANTTGTRKIKVGIVETLPTAETINSIEYELIDEITSTTQTYQYYSKSLESYKGNGHYIIFVEDYGNGTTSGGGMYIDDLVLEPIPSCFVPSGVEVENVVHHNADVIITPNSDSDANTWQIAVVPDSLVSEIATASDVETYASQLITTSDKKYTLSGLAHTTKYKVYVRTICSENDKSSWTDPVSFETIMMLTENTTWLFETNEPVLYGNGSSQYPYPKGWEVGVKSHFNDTYVQSYRPQIDYNRSGAGTVRYAKQGNQALRFADYITSNTQVRDSSYVILPAFDMEGKKQISFDIRAGQFVRQTPEDSNIDTASFGMTATIGIGLIDSLGTIDSYEPIGEYKLNSKVGEKATPDNRLMFDHIVVELPEQLACRQVVIMKYDKSWSLNAASIVIDSLSVTDSKNLTTPSVKTQGGVDYVTLTWPANGNAKWNVYVFEGVVQLLDVDPAKLQKIEVTEPTYTAKDLKANSVYSIYVQIAGKESELGATSPRVLYQTPGSAYPVGTVFKFPDDDRELLSGTYYAPAGWVVGNVSLGVSTLKEGTITTATFQQVPRLCAPTSSAKYDMKDSENSALGLYSISSSTAYAGQYAIMPLVAADSLNNLQLEFYMRDLYENPTYGTASFSSLTDDYDRTIVVGTLTDPSDFSTFTPLDTLDYTVRPYEDLVAHRQGTVQGTVVADHPTWYYQKKVVPLENATGNYIAFYAPTHYRPAIYIEDVVVQPRSGMVEPNILRSSAVDSVSATLNWKGYQDGNYVVRVATDRQLTNLFKEYTLKETTLELTGLTPGTQYYWAVKQLGSGSDESQLSSVERFRTLSAKVDPNYSTGFEMEEGWYKLQGFYNDDYKVTNGWYYSSETPNASYTYTPKNVVNQEVDGSTTPKTAYSHRGMFALEINSHTSTNGAYAVMPPLATDRFDTLQVNFFLGASSYYTQGTNAGKVQSNFTTTSYEHAIEVGTCTDPTDPSTFVPLEVVYYDGVFTGTSANISNESNDFRYEYKSVSLEGAVGPYVYFRSNFSKNNRVFIDDITISQYNGCLAPTILQSTNITATSADLTWEHFNGDAWKVEIATDREFDNVVLTFADVKTNNLSVTGLNPNNTYYWHVQQTCKAEAEGETDALSDWSGFAYFDTWKAPLFNENFMSNIMDEGWIDANPNIASGTLKSVVNGTNPLPTDRNFSSAWQRSTNGNGLSTAHLYVRTNSIGTDWLITPVIQLNETDDAMLQFDLAITRDDSPLPAEFYPQSRDDQFIVIISEDAGKTWSLDNATIWNNDSISDTSDALYRYGIGQYNLFEVSYTGESFRIDLTKYKGKPIRIAFYVENTIKKLESQRGTDIHIDNIHVNYVEQVNIPITICQYEDYEDATLDYYIDGDMVAPGTFELEQMILSTNAAVKDSLFVLTANVLEAPQTSYSDTIRQGSVYAKDAFTDKVKGGIYKYKGTSAVTGCDSIAVLDLTVLQPILIEDEQNLCATQVPYVMNGKEYTRTGLYRDTVYSNVENRPDTIYVLVLTVQNVFENSLDVTVCHNETYTYQEQVLSTSGEYVFHLESVSGCDSVVTINFTVLPELIDTIYDTFVEGEVYSKGDFTDKSEPGYYSVHYTTALGCDSVVVLNLEYATGLANMFGSYITLTPSILSVGETVNVDYNFTSAQLAGMKIEVFDIVGKLVTSIRPNTSSEKISIDAFQVAGVYNVTITTGTAETFYGRVIVK